MRTITSRGFNQDVSQAKRLAQAEPVFVTHRGKATHVLMSVEAYRKLTDQVETILDLLARPDLSEIDLSSPSWGLVWDERRGG